jgi:hypothetical protein
MMDIPQIKKRLGSAIDSYVEYAHEIQYLGDNKYAVKGEYEVNLNTQRCTCQDNSIRGESTPCKHIIMVWLYAYFTAHEPDFPE